MLVQDFYIDDYDWHVRVYYAVTCYYAQRITRDLHDIGCSRENLKDAYENMLTCSLDRGITYSNYKRRETVMVISLTSSAAEFQSTWDHEKGHLVKHMAQCFGMDPYGEEQQYLSGEIGKQMFPFAKIFLCENCKRDLARSM